MDCISCICGKKKTTRMGSKQSRLTTGSHPDRTTRRHSKRMTSSPGLCIIGGITNSMSAVFQCFCNITPLVEYFLSDRYQTDMSNTHALGMRGDIAEAFNDLCLVVWSGRYESISPNALRNALCHFESRFRGEIDAMDLIKTMLVVMHEDLNRVRPDTPRPHQKKLNIARATDDQLAADVWRRYRTYNDSIIVDLFHGMAKRTIGCRSCEREDVNFEEFYTLSLNLPGSHESEVGVGDVKPVTLEDCMNLLVAKERSIEHICPECSTEGPASARYELWSLPEVLIIRLKRFSYDRESDRYRKIDDPVEFPIRDFDPRKWIREPKPPGGTYDLTAILNHVSMDGESRGHYYAVVKNKLTDDWFQFDDSMAIKVDEIDLVTPFAYLLVYVRGKK